MKGYIKRLLREGLLDEEYDGHNLYGYHVTTNNPKSIDDIKLNGFKVGDGRMEGKGLYSFYDLERACGYSSKEFRTNIIVKFEVKSIDKILILDMDIAKKILGDEYHIVNQLEKLHGLDYYYQNKIDVSLTKKEYIAKLYDIENMDTRDIGPEFFTMHKMVVENEVNVINYSPNYGMQIRINNINITKPIGIYELEPFTKNVINYIEF